MTTPSRPKFSKLTWLKRTDGHDFTGAEFRVLVAIFNHTNAHGQNAYPGVARLIQETVYVESAVKGAIKGLKARGWIHEVSRGNNVTGRKSVYDLIPDAPRPPVTSSPEALQGSSPEDVRGGSPEDPNNQILRSDPLSDHVERPASTDRTHSSGGVGSSPVGHSLPSGEVHTSAAESSGSDQTIPAAEVIHWPTDKTLPPAWDLNPFATYVDASTGKVRARDGRWV